MDWTAILEGSLSFFLVVTALALAYVLLRMGGTFTRLNIFVKRLDEEVIPLLSQLQTTLDEVNDQLKSVDGMVDTLTGVTQRVDRTTKTVSSVITNPVKKAAGLSAGLTEAVSSMMDSYRGRS
ncbi:MAG: DUF948 domain-containing protein [Thermoleophilia bacterium]